MKIVSSHWRDSARRPKFFIIDAIASFPLLLWFLHIRWWTFYLSVSIMVFFYILQYFHFTLPVFLRWLRAELAGPHRVSLPSWRK